MVFRRLLTTMPIAGGDRNWPGIEWNKALIYELHLGTFTAGGTFLSAVEKLDYLLELGINTVELMPLTETPGRWNWVTMGSTCSGVNHKYGTPDELKYLIDCCHQKGLAVLLDIVYNHFGPEGNYLGKFGPYFTENIRRRGEQPLTTMIPVVKRRRQMVLDSVYHWSRTLPF